MITLTPSSPSATSLFFVDGIARFEVITITLPNSETYFGDLPVDGNDSTFGRWLRVHANGQRLYQGGASGSGYERDYEEAADGTGQTTITVSSNWPADTRWAFEIVKP